MDKSNNLFQRLGQGETAAGMSGLALLILLLFPWFSWVNTGMVISDSGGSHSPQGTMTIWQAMPFLGYLLLFSGAVAVGIAVFKIIRRVKLPSLASTLLIAFGVISAGLMLKSVISPPTEVDLGGIVMLNNLQIVPTIGLWLGLAAAIGLICGGLLIARHRENPISN